MGYAIVPILLAAQALLFPAQVNAQNYLQCVPYARQLSGIQIYGDAHTWWKQSKGRYQRGEIPVEGAVMSLKSHGKMRLGHVAYVSKVLDSRNILLNHSNWSPINGRRGQIERNVAAVDVSKNNDWSEVKIWYAPIGGLGKTAYPVNGFIYSDRASQKQSDTRQWVSAKAIKKGRAPNRNLFARHLTEDLQREARSETFAANELSAQPTDLIGDLLDTLGN
ncbi:MAG: hypothetical protein Pars2KO_31880 [Parasphingorhabdus sp.]